ncbi:hypothetical protein ACFVH9_07415 [Streptomyces hirsutus]|uniref:hypothetical protein n=1 Tax=Streptomyces hirsutus TaxID=35620 RepID=UPI003642327A
MAADDDAERRRIEARLYTRPKELRKPGSSRRMASRTEGSQRGQMTVQDATSLMAQLAAQDAQLGAR